VDLPVAAGGGPPLGASARRAGGGFAYDKEMTLMGTLQEVEWVNPHGSFFLDGADEDGEGTT